MFIHDFEVSFHNFDCNLSIIEMTNVSFLCFQILMSAL